MSMTREQAIKHIEDIRASALENLGAKYAYGCEGYYRTRIELSDICLTALRPVSREQIKKVWRGEWIDTNHGTSSCKCTKCGAVQEYETPFCSYCGAPMTDEAVEMVMERLEALKDD